MFQSMFRNRGRPPDPLPIGGYEQPSNEESNHIPVHQLMETPRQLPLPSVRELEQDAIMQQEPNEVSNMFVEPSSSQQLQQDDNMSVPQERRLALKPQHRTVHAWYEASRAQRGPFLFSGRSDRSAQAPKRATPLRDCEEPHCKTSN